MKRLSRKTEVEYGQLDSSLESLNNQARYFYYQFEDEQLCAALCQLGKHYQKQDAQELAQHMYVADIQLSYKLGKHLACGTTLASLSCTLLSKQFDDDDE